MADHLGKIVCGQVEFKLNRFMFWCRTGEWVFTTKWRIYQGIWERNILTVGTLKACFTSCSPFHRVSCRSGTAWGSLTNWHLPLCLRPEGSSEEGVQGNLISLCLSVQSSAKLAFFGNWALMPGVWERLEAPRESEEWFAARRWLSSRWPLKRQGTWTSSSPPSLACMLQWTPHAGHSQLLPHLFLTSRPPSVKEGSLVFLTGEGGSELDYSGRSSSSRTEMEGKVLSGILHSWISGNWSF